MIEREQFNYGRSTLEYQIMYEKRKNLAITVRPDKTIIAKAPLNSRIEEIEKKLRQRGKWILK